MKLSGVCLVHYTAYLFVFIVERQCLADTLLDVLVRGWGKGGEKKIVLAPVQGVMPAVC